MLREHGVLWGGEKAKLVGLCMNPRAEGGSGAEDRLVSSHPSVDLRRWQKARHMEKQERSWLLQQTLSFLKNKYCVIEHKIGRAHV